MRAGSSSAREPTTVVRSHTGLIFYVYANQSEVDYATQVTAVGILSSTLFGPSTIHGDSGSETAQTTSLSFKVSIRRL